MSPQCSFQKRGSEIIDEDLKRLKNYTSLIDDLDKIFEEINNAWIRYGVLRDEKCLIYKDDEKGLYFFKRRCPISSHGLSKENGARIIYCIINKKIYIPFLVFLAKEEDKYPLSECKRTVKERIKIYYEIITA